MKDKEWLTGIILQELISGIDLDTFVGDEPEDIIGRLIDDAIWIAEKTCEKLSADSPKRSKNLAAQTILHQCQIDNFFTDLYWIPVTTPPPEGKLVVLQFFPEYKERVLVIGYRKGDNYFSAEDDDHLSLVPGYWLNIPPMPHVFPATGVN